MNANDVRFVQDLLREHNKGTAQAIEEKLAVRDARIKQLEQQVGLLQNALAQSGQKFVLPADEHQPLSFTTTRRRA